jgi:hypothetical protein
MGLDIPKRLRQFLRRRIGRKSFKHPVGHLGAQIGRQLLQRLGTAREQGDGEVALRGQDAGYAGALFFGGGS